VKAQNEFEVILIRFLAGYSDIMETTLEGGDAKEG
jgi:hypothetical protein